MLRGAQGGGGRPPSKFAGIDLGDQTAACRGAQRLPTNVHVPQHRWARAGARTGPARRWGTLFTARSRARLHSRHLETLLASLPAVCAVIAGL